MTNDQFEAILNSRIEKIKDVLSNKAKEYASNKDRLHNFKQAARVGNITPERALFGMFLKHFVSVMDIIENIDIGLLPTKELLNEKIGDAINYLILLEALIKERNKKEKDQYVFETFYISGEINEK